MYRFKINMLTNSDAIIEILAAQNTDSGFPPSFRSKYANGKAAQVHCQPLYLNGEYAP